MGEGEEEEEGVGEGEEEEEARAYAGVRLLCKKELNCRYREEEG